MPAKIRPGWKWLTVVNALAYYEAVIITTVKRFKAQTVGFIMYVWKCVRYLIRHTDLTLNPILGIYGSRIQGRKETLSFEKHVHLCG